MLGAGKRHRPCRRQTVGLYGYGFSGFTSYFMTLILTFSGSGRARGTGTSRGTGSGSDRTGSGSGRGRGGGGARGGGGGGGGGAGAAGRPGVGVAGREGPGVGAAVFTFFLAGPLAALGAMAGTAPSVSHLTLLLLQPQQAWLPFLC